MAYASKGVFIECNSQSMIKALTFRQNGICEYESENSSNIVMDKFGQIPDHFHFAGDSPHPPLHVAQVKRQLDLGTNGEDENSKRLTKKRRRTRKNSNVGEDIEKSRFDTSLVCITKKFVGLLSSSLDGVVDLKKACTELSVPQRRMYDITNVLEGAGLLEKKSRNNVRWKRNKEHGDEVRMNLESDIDILEIKENCLDDVIKHAEAAIAATREQNEEYTYITCEDLKSMAGFGNDTVIGIKATPETVLHVPEFYKLCLKSKGEPIGAYLAGEDEFTILGRQPTSRDTFKISDSKVCAVANPILKRALISEQDDLPPPGESFLPQTEDQLCDNLSVDPVMEYDFILDDGEGLADIFDISELSYI